VDHHKIASEVEGKYSGLLKDIAKVLETHGLANLAISSVEFVVKDAAVPALRTDNCPKGTVPKQVCVTKPGGAIYCYTTCEPTGS
jgi:hypothetical protein